MPSVFVIGESFIQAESHKEAALMYLLQHKVPEGVQLRVWDWDLTPVDFVTVIEQLAVTA